MPFPYFRGSLTARMFCAGFSEGKKDACQVTLALIFLCIKKKLAMDAILKVKLKVENINIDT